MKRRNESCVVVLLPLGIFIGVCLAFCPCTWALLDSGRSIGTYDLGHNRRVRIYSERPDMLENASVLFVIEHDGQKVFGPRWLGIDVGKSYEFRVVHSSDGMVSGVFDVPGELYATILFDHETQEGFSAMTDSTDDPSVAHRWSERYSRLRAAAPEFPVIDSLEKPAR